jgi:hypothetical protein
MDVSTLQAALPNLSSSFLDGLPESWFSNNTSTYVPSGSHGELHLVASYDCDAFSFLCTVDMIVMLLST